MPATTPAKTAWRNGVAERPGLAQDEFIDDIPFPETQNYVKRILGTAEDYRRLYGGGLLTPGSLRDGPGQRSRRRQAEDAGEEEGAGEGEDTLIGWTISST